MSQQLSIQSKLRETTNRTKKIELMGIEGLRSSRYRLMQQVCGVGILMALVSFGLSFVVWFHWALVMNGPSF